MKYSIIIVLAAALVGCKSHELCIQPERSYSSPYEEPIWHPSGNLIGFNHIPVKSVDYYPATDNCPATVGYNYADSVGFYIVNVDGSGQHRIYSRMQISPTWSPDGKSLSVCKYGGGIYNLPFDGRQLDTTAMQALPLKGWCRHPDWSKDGKKIAYTQLSNDIIIYGVLIHNFDTEQSESISIYGDYPSWSPNSDSLYFSKNATNDHDDIGDSLFVYDTNTRLKKLIKFISSPNVDNRYFKCSPDGKSIAFVSALNNGQGMQLYKINSNGSGLTKLTDNGCLKFSWSPDGRKIVYVSYDYKNISKTQGTLWIMDADGNNKKPLTFNFFETDK